MAKDLDRTTRASRVFQTLSFAKRVQVQRAQLRETAVTRLQRGTNVKLWTRNVRRELFNGQELFDRQIPLAGIVVEAQHPAARCKLRQFLRDRGERRAEG